MKKASSKKTVSTSLNKLMKAPGKVPQQAMALAYRTSGKTAPPPAKKGK